MAITSLRGVAAFLLPVFGLLAVLAGLGASASTAQAQLKSAKILVLPFEVNADPELAYLQESLPRLLSDKLVELGFATVPLEEMYTVLQEQKVDRLDLAIARDLALLTGAEYAVYGSFSQVGEAISLDVRVTDAFGLKPAKAVFVSKEGVISILPAVEELAGKIRLELLSKEKINDIEVQGTVILDEDVVLLRMRTQKGDIFDPAQLNKDLKAIYDLGYFEDVVMAVEDEPGGKKVIVVVEEKPRIGTVGVEGNKELDDDDVLEVMTTKSGAVLNPQLLSEDLVRIRELYRREGYYKAKVDYRLEGGQSGQARLSILVDEGPELYIESIEIRGAEQLKAKRIKGELALKEKGILSFLTHSGVLDEQMLDRDVASIESYYANRGFLDAKVGKPVVEYKDDGIYITFYVEEGPRYTVKSLSYRGDLIFDEGILNALVKTDELAEDGEYLDRSVVRADMQKLADFYGNYGYAFADAGLDLKKDTDANTVDLTFVLTKNQKVRIRRVLVEGNTKTRDNVVLREMRLTDGDVFSGAGLSRSSERLEKLDYFDEVDIETIPTAQDDLLDLKVRVKEKATGQLSAGAGYSSYSNIFLTAAIQERNLFGKGYMLGFSGSFSGKGTTYQLSFTNPHLNDSKVSLGTDLYILNQEFLEFDRDTVGGRVRVGYPVGEYTRAFVSYRLDKYDVSEVDQDAAQLIKDLEDRSWASVAGVAVERSSTNRRFLPTRGTKFGVSMEYGGGLLQGDDDFIKLIAEADWFKSLFWNVTFHWHGSIGRALKNFTDEEVPSYERFYLGGINSVRGYKGRHISPRDDATGDRIGGTKSFYSNFELSSPLHEDMGLYGVLFFDVGNAWDEDETYFGGESDAAASELTLGLFKSVGGGIRWLSPMGPLRLEYGFPLDDLAGTSSSGRFEFSMGTDF